MARVVFLSNMEETRPNLWEPVAMGNAQANGNFPIVWACDRIHNVAVGVAEVTTQQGNALATRGVWTLPEADLALTLAELSTPQQNAITGWLDDHSIAWAPTDTLQAIAERVMALAQPGWTWPTLTAQLHNWGL